MEKLIEKSHTMIRTTRIHYRRYLLGQIDWDNRLIGIKGARGNGKTTMILQHMKEHYGTDHRSLYVSMDDIYFSAHRLVEMTDTFVKNGGKRLFLDEVHKYPNWSQELKNIYDDYRELYVVFISSSALQVDRGAYDLSRRAVIYQLHDLSLREYVEMSGHAKFQVFSLEEILKHHTDICSEVVGKIRPVEHFNEFIRYGSYPFYFEGKTKYYERIEAVINQVLEGDLPSITGIEYQTVTKMKKMLYIISGNVPFYPNISDLARKIGTSRDILLKYLDLLHHAGLIYLLKSHTRGVSYLSKPDKIYLNNTTLMYALNESRVNTGSMRETFFMNQVSCGHMLTSSDSADFKVDDLYSFEIGGKNKPGDQIKGIENSYIVSDNIEYGHQNRIPLWLFGFLY